MHKILPLLLFFVIGCSKDVEVDQPKYTPKVVVDGWIANDDFARVYLTMSSPFLTNYDSASIRATFMNYAKVTIFTGKGDKEVLTLFRRDEFFPPFVYKTTRIKGESGETYRIKIENEGKVIESTTSIPQVPVVNNVSVIETSDTTINFEVEVLDNIHKSEYYFSQIEIKGVDTFFHPASFPLKNDSEFIGGKGTVRIYSSGQPDPLDLSEENEERDLPPYQFSINDTVFVKFSKVDETSFKVLNDIYLDNINSGNPFAFVNKKTRTNIVGGIGRWTGLGTRSFAISKKGFDWLDD